MTSSGPLHLTKIAFGAKSYADIEGWFANRPRVSLTTRYCPKRVEELAGGSLYWIHEHAIVARSPFQDYYVARSALLFARKHAAWFTPVAAAHSVIRFLLPKIVRRQWPRARSVLRAYGDFARGR